jgi:hypothetical protein
MRCALLDSDRTKFGLLLLASLDDERQRRQSTMPHGTSSRVYSSLTNSTTCFREREPTKKVLFCDLSIIFEQ